MKNRILAVLTALVLMCMLTVNASATEVLPPLQEKGSLTIEMTYNGEALTTGKVSILQVGVLEEITENHYDFRIFGALGRESITQEECSDPEVAKALLAAGKETLSDKIRTLAVTEGAAVFTELDAGLYLVWQEDADACKDLSAIQPFLISLPIWVEDHYVLDVVAAPKVPVQPAPTPPPPPPPPPPPDLPQTGQLNWPIPVMAIAGALLVILGIVLCAIRKRDPYEK